MKIKDYLEKYGYFAMKFMFFRVKEPTFAAIPSVQVWFIICMLILFKGKVAKIQKNAIFAKIQRNANFRSLKEKWRKFRKKAIFLF